MGAPYLRPPGLLWHLFKEQVKRPFYAVYQRRLIAKASSWALPQHIGIIMDGNRRYARQSGLLDVNEGHARGAEKLQEVLLWPSQVLALWHPLLLPRKSLMGL